MLRSFDVHAVENKFGIGATVQCIDPPNQTGYKQIPVKGGIYTIRYIRHALGRTLILLEELDNKVEGHKPEPGFYLKRFKIL
jgi:hypothetical protein